MIMIRSIRQRVSKDSYKDNNTSSQRLLDNHNSFLKLIPVWLHDEAMFDILKRWSVSVQVEP